MWFSRESLIEEMSIFLKVWRKIHSKQSLLSESLEENSFKSCASWNPFSTFVPACRTLAPLLTASFVVFQESSHSQWHWIKLCRWSTSMAVPFLLRLLYLLLLECKFSNIYIYICMGMYVYMYLACWEKLWRFCDEFYSFFGWSSLKFLPFFVV